VNLSPDDEIILLELQIGAAPQENDIEERPAMVVLGHFHLVGGDGVLAQLEAAGMTVRRI
jgi:uncharacterized protein YbaP (TraB family)